MMRMFVEPESVYLYRDYVDFRKAINGLAALVELELDVSPKDGALFVFCNKAKNKLKILYWDRTGFALWQKRLEKAKFKWPSQHACETLELNEQQLNWLLGGYDVIGHNPVSYRAVS
ncbi:IS66 family insertion sequence element accessory protein TnpB [Thalassomonas viridans]|uniref:IS66 family insertion sequence element accessory protein TnpB n=2 Tax=Thalassomonas viridans TaxID=137584 RepID=A0AAF0CA64_9GAMM|nr:IS66 family insertion sequence element accessory protein TnpB [Thalassomonas viridans]WDE08429.1 IS66 family insertion sequence element accessory protein TnpB [Thalassomonas viridans]WDE09311.1 IS66 family insertion sequence element accessory protein TnpB [Thalassomonas viridans]WDE09328.1 IS66 family insertion sequence element accessory protein TnpB [Thalassomonas viridans]WDE09342.1 IS66 family insertion sequence element accessory protein TnpB [Thalassomonas viridans]